MAKKIYGAPQLDKGKKTGLLIALAMLFFFNNGDTVMLSTATMTILSDIGGTDFYALMFSAKMLTNAVCMMLGGKLADKFGRRNILFIGSLIVMVGYFMCGISGDMVQMIIWRAVTGCGSGLTIGLCYVVMGDLFTGKSHAMAYQINVIASGIAMVAGPTLGGVVIQYVHWHWIFWILVPMAFVAAILVMGCVPDYRMDSAGTKTDISGMVLFALAMSALLTWLSVVGTFYKITDTFSIVLLVVAVVLLILFVINEARCEDTIAVAPVSMFKYRYYAICAIGQLSMTLNALIILTYFPYYMQGAMGYSASQSGLVVSAVYLTSTVFGFVLLRVIGVKQIFTPFCKATLLMGTVALIVICFVLHPQMSMPAIFALMIFFGFASSVEGSIFLMTAQEGASPKKMAVATSGISFVQAFAACLGSAVGGAVINLSSDFISGCMNSFVCAAVITTIGCILVLIFLPKDSAIREAKASLIAIESEQTAEATKAE